MVDQVIAGINSRLSEFFKKFPGVKVYGMTQPMIKTQKIGKNTVFPAVVDQEGEGKWVGVDDTAPLIMYHRTTGPMSVRYFEGYGDLQDTVNTYNNALIVSYDRSKIKLTTDEIQQYIQVSFPTMAKNANFKSIRINISSVILNSQQVYQSEYQNGKTVDPKISMVQINYQIETRFSSACFAQCL